MPARKELAVLFQKDPQTGHMNPIAYAGRSVSKSERNYEVTKQELLALVYGVRHFDVYLRGRPFHAYTNHAPLTGLIKKRDLNGQMARLVLALQAYSYELHYIPGSTNALPDFLSRVSYDKTHTSGDNWIDSFPDPPPCDNDACQSPPCPIPEVVQKVCVSSSTQTDPDPVPPSSDPSPPPGYCDPHQQAHPPVLPVLQGG